MKKFLGIFVLGLLILVTNLNSSNSTAKTKVFDKNSTIVEIPKWKSIDIDTISDWKYAEMTMKIKKNEKKISL